MNIKELRIGNLIKHMGKAVEVKSLIKNPRGFDYDEINLRPDKYFAPLPLTIHVALCIFTDDEHLGKDDDRNYSFQRGHSILSFPNKGETSESAVFYPYDDITALEIRTLHALQNAYFYDYWLLRFVCGPVLFLPRIQTPRYF